jgi:hypothetical protein
MLRAQSIPASRWQWKSCSGQQLLWGHCSHSVLSAHYSSFRTRLELFINRQVFLFFCFCVIFLSFWCMFSLLRSCVLSCKHALAESG